MAGTLFRERGFDGIGVADIMKGAGLKHGGFYGHFASNDAWPPGRPVPGCSGGRGGLSDSPTRHPRRGAAQQPWFPARNLFRANRLPLGTLLKVAREQPKLLERNLLNRNGL